MSTKHQEEEGISLDVQDEIIAEYCEQNGLDLIGIVREVWSGTKLARDKLDTEVIPLVLEGRITHIVCYDQDRWARDEYARLKLEREILEPNGVELVIVNEGTFANSYDKELVRGIKGSVAQHFAHYIRHKIVGAMNFKAENVEYCGGNVPYGYMPEKAGTRTNNQGKILVLKKFVPHPDESKVVLFAKELYALGHSSVFPMPAGFGGRGHYGSSVICDILNALPLTQRNGEPFSTVFVKKLLKDVNDCHLGTYTYGKTYGDKDERKRRKSSFHPEKEVHRIKNAFPPIVSQELQKACRDKLKASAQRNRTTDRFTVENTEYMGSGVFNCKACGSIMVGRTQGRDSKHHVTRFSYMCSSRRNRKGCEAKTINAEYIHRGLNELVYLFTADPTNVERTIRHALEIIEQQRKREPSSKEEFADKLKAVEFKKKNLMANLEEASGLGKLLEPRLRELDRQEAQLKETLRQLEESKLNGTDIDVEQQVRKALKNIGAVWSDASLCQKNQLLKALIRQAKIDTASKEVEYLLSVPIDNQTGRPGGGTPGPGSGIALKRGGRPGIMAEVHGNRTHPPARHRCTGFEDQEAHQAPWHFRLMAILCHISE